MEEGSKYRVVTASEITRLVVGEPSGGENNKIFGMVFEECYSNKEYILWKGGGSGRVLPKRFRAAVGANLKAAGIADSKIRSDMVRRAWMMSCCLLATGVQGLKPRTRFRELNNEIMIAGQPDVERDDGKVIEYKTYPINEYARCQTRVFSWVWERSVSFVGLVYSEGRYRAEEEIIDGSTFDFPPIPDEMGTVQTFIGGEPEHYARHRRDSDMMYDHSWDEDDEDDDYW